MSQFPSKTVKEKASEVFNFLYGMKIADIKETLHLVDIYVSSFCAKQILSPTIKHKTTREDLLADPENQENPSL